MASSNVTVTMIARGCGFAMIMSGFVLERAGFAEINLVEGNAIAGEGEERTQGHWEGMVLVKFIRYKLKPNKDFNGSILT